MRKNRLVWLCFSSIFLMGACSTRPAATQTFTPPPANPENSQVVSVQATPIPPAFKAGRFALQIDSQPPQSFITSFDLTGGWPDGALNIYSPLGIQMARVEWTAQSARLLQGNQVRFNGCLFNKACRNSKLYATARQSRKFASRLGSSYPHTPRL